MVMEGGSKDINKEDNEISKNDNTSNSSASLKQVENNSTSDIPPINFDDIDKDHYLIGKLLGSGASGVVVRGYDWIQKRPVAIKQMTNIYQHPDTVRKIIRELRLLHSLRGPNIVSLFGLQLSKSSIYMISEYCETDLHKLIYSQTRRPEEYISIMYQTLSAIEFIHSVKVLHRDIKPANILIDCNLNVKLCDFGLSRIVHGKCDAVILPHEKPITEYVVSRWYRAPEVVLAPGRYGKAQDVWGAACSFAEIFKRAPLFPGTSILNQLHVIVDILGKPTPEDLDLEMSSRSRRYMEYIQASNIGLKQACGDLDKIHSNLYMLLEQMLKFNPYHRITARQALQYPIFDQVRHSRIPTNIRKKRISPTLDSDIDRIDRCEGSIPELTRLLINEISGIQTELIIPSTSKEPVPTEHAIDQMPESPPTTATRLSIFMETNADSRQSRSCSTTSDNTSPKQSFLQSKSNHQNSKQIDYMNHKSESSSSNDSMKVQRSVTPVRSPRIFQRKPTSSSSSGKERGASPIADQLRSFSPFSRFLVASSSFSKPSSPLDTTAPQLQPPPFHIAQRRQRRASRFAVKDGAASTNSTKGVPGITRSRSKRRHTTHAGEEESLMTEEEGFMRQRMFQVRFSVSSNSTKPRAQSVTGSSNALLAALRARFNFNREFPSQNVQASGDGNGGSKKNDKNEISSGRESQSSGGSGRDRYLSPQEDNRYYERKVRMKNDRSRQQVDSAALCSDSDDIDSLSATVIPSSRKDLFRKKISKRKQSHKISLSQNSDVHYKSEEIGSNKERSEISYSNENVSDNYYNTESEDIDVTVRSQSPGGGYKVEQHELVHNNEDSFNPSMSRSGSTESYCSVKLPQRDTYRFGLVVENKEASDEEEKPVSESIQLDTLVGDIVIATENANEIIKQPNSLPINSNETIMNSNETSQIIRQLSVSEGSPINEEKALELQRAHKRYSDNSNCEDDRLTGPEGVDRVAQSTGDTQGKSNISGMRNWVHIMRTALQTFLCRSSPSEIITLSASLPDIPSHSSPCLNYLKANIDVSAEGEGEILSNDQQQGKEVQKNSPEFTSRVNVTERNDFQIIRPIRSSQINQNNPYRSEF